MGCVKDISCGTRTIIGIRDYASCSKPESGLFIQDLPGISLKNAAAIADEEKQTGRNVLDQSIKMAVKHVFDEFIAELGPFFKFNAIVETRQTNIFTGEIIPVAALERGIVLKRWRSEMSRIYIDELYVKVYDAGTATIKILDGCKQVEYEVELSAQCVNTVKIDYMADSEEVKIVFNQTTFRTGTTSTNRISTGCSSCGYSSTKGFSIAGWNGTNEDGKSYGLGVYATVRCYEENVFCTLLPRMYFLMWYKSGIVFLEEFLASTRVNNLTLYGKEQAKELLKNYEAKYKEKYQVIIKSAYDYIKSTKGECLQCNGNRYVQSTP